MPGMMQLDLLVGRGVYDRTGKKIAAVSEVRLQREGDAYVFDGLLIGTVGFIERIGLDPAVRQLGKLLGFEGWRPEVRVVRWPQIERIDAHKVHLRVRLAEVEVLDPGE